MGSSSGGVGRYEEIPENIRSFIESKKCPNPVTWHVLVYPLTLNEKTEGGIIVPLERQDKERTASVCALVLGLGADCYDPKKFKEPACVVGDYILMNAYSGTTFGVDGQRFRIINDDTILCTVENPSGVSRA